MIYYQKVWFNVVLQCTAVARSLYVTCSVAEWSIM